MNTVRSILVQNSAPASEVPEQRIFINSTENVVDNLQSEISESRPVLHVLNVGSDAKQRSDTPLPSIASAESSESPALASPNNLLHQNFHNSTIKNVFGNGWTNAPSASVPFTKRGILDSPFSLHIALAAIQGAYEALSSTTDIHLPSIQQKFGRVLRHHTREQILFNLRWSLGPGIADLGRLAMASFDQTSSCGSVSSLGLENRIEYGDFERRQDDCSLGSSDEESEAVCNADDVARWIRQRTTTEIDGDVLELNVKSLEEHTKRRSPEAFKLGLYGYVPGMPNADTFGDYYDGHSKTGVVRISKSLFLQNVIEIGFCLHVGPAFGEKKLGQVVRASMVPCYNDGL
ncbi:hypothetical protein C8034_v009549 [Colletotrichum sidae]|uniref:Uncharacterized protein n=1 Tax=Colletotrichum sidae TaxID=1347389 RepID=A0A4R8T1U5_9PEZI|nr:hypothetical protein C8034_v009549 [Colletotrichum sidae]